MPTKSDAELHARVERALRVALATPPAKPRKRKARAPKTSKRK